MKIDPDTFVSSILCIYVNLVAWGIINASKNPEKNKIWLDQWGNYLKICGAFLLFFTIYSIFK